VLLSGGLYNVANQSIFSTVIFLLSGTISSGIGAILIYQGIDRVGASVNTAVTNSRPLFAVIFGFVLLEFPPISTIIAIILLVIGVLIISLSRGGDVRGWCKSDLIYPLGAAIAFSIGNVIRRYGLTQTNITLFAAIAINSIGGLVILLYAGHRHDKNIINVPIHTYLWSILTGISTSMSLLATFFALKRVNVAVVESLLAIAPLATILLAAVFLRDFERVTIRVVVGSIFVVIGSVAIVTL
jgi:drug/metabolite transporter (DMT)-like permease